MLCTGKTVEDYFWFADKIRSAIQPMLKEGEPGHVSCFVTDGEEALIKGFQMCPLFDKDLCSHVLCELHLKENDKIQLRKRGFDDKQIQEVFRQVYGWEQPQPDLSGRRRMMGLVDYPPIDFYRLLEHQYAPEWNAIEMAAGKVTPGQPTWVEWFWNYVVVF